MAKKNADAKPKSQKAKGLSISVKIITMSLACLVAAILVTVTISTNIASQRLVSKAEQDLETSANSKGKALEDFIVAQKVLTRSVAENETLINAAKEYKQTGTQDVKAQAALTSLLGNIESNSGNLYENFFVTVGEEGFADCLENATLHNCGRGAVLCCLSKRGQLHRQ